MRHKVLRNALLLAACLGPPGFADEDVLELEPIIIHPEDDPLFEAEQRIRALSRDLPDSAEPRDGLRDRIRRALGADHDVTKLPLEEQQQIADQIDALQGLGPVGEREAPGPQMPVRLSDRERLIQEALEGQTDP